MPQRPTGEAVAALLRAQFPGLAPFRVTPRDGGPDETSWDVNGEWIFRFPRRRDAEAALEREIALTARLAPRLSLPIPAFTEIGTPCADFPFRFAGYRRLEGAPAMGVEGGPPAAALGRFLGELHSFPVEAAAAVGVLRDDSSRNLDRLQEEAAGAFARLREALPAGASGPCWKLLSRKEASSPARVCLAHTDLTAEHILVSPDGREIAGILDWADAAIGDPAVDFAGLYAWRGEEFLRGAVRHYAAPVDEGMLRRARLIGLTVACLNLLYGLEARRDEYVAFGRGAIGRLLARAE